MKFDPATLLTTAFLTLFLFGMVLAVVVRRSGEDRAGLWWIASFLLGASGFLLLVLAPAGPGSLQLLVANTLFLSAYGCCHAGARSLAGRKPLVWPLIVAFAIWPLLCGLFELGFASRVVVCSILVCGYSAAAAFELVHGATKEERNRLIAAGLCAAHALFYLIRAAFGPTLGLINAATEDVESAWGAAIALEIVLFAAAMATLIVGTIAERRGLKERRAANTDFLTGIGSRRAFDATMRRVVPATEDGVPTALLLLDLDEFKKVNDRLGHQAGDTLLKTFAQVVRQQLRDPDMFWRLGGDEFAILLRGCDLHESESLKASLRQAIEMSSVIRKAAGGARVSASMGSAAVLPGEGIADLVRRADAALYRDKDRRKPAYFKGYFASRAA